jgi:hypothetical protein
MEHDLYPLRTLCGASDKACAHYVRNYLLNTEYKGFM